MTSLQSEICYSRRCSHKMFYCFLAYGNVGYRQTSVQKVLCFAEQITWRETLRVVQVACIRRQWRQPRLTINKNIFAMAVWVSVMIRSSSGSQLWQITKHGALHNFARSGRWKGTQDMSAKVGISIGSVHNVSHKDLNKHYLYQNLVPTT
jgi:hypothetical protein